MNAQLEAQLKAELDAVLDKIEEDIKESQTYLARKRLSTYDFVRCVLLHAKCVSLTDSFGENVIMYKDYIKGGYSKDFRVFKRLVKIAAEKFRQIGALSESEFYTMFDGWFEDDNVFKQLISLPPHYIPTTYGCYDIFSQSYISKEKESRYYVPGRINVNLLEPVDEDDVNYKIRNVLFDDWSNHDRRANEALRFFQYCALIGYGGQSLIFLVGTGGNGKSTYEDMTVNLVGSEYSKHIEVTELIRDDIAVNITPQLKLIYGKELDENLTIGAHLTSTLKKYIEGTSWNLSRKYLSSVNVSSNAVKMQATNALPKIIGFGPAMTRRLIVIDFGDVNHTSTNNERLKSLTNESVATLIYDEEFLATNVKALINEFQFSSKQELLRKYQDIKKSLSELYEAKMSHSKEEIVQFFEECDYNQVFTQEIIPVKCMYEAFKRFVKENNMNGGVLSHAKFAQKLLSFLEKRGFVVDERRARPRTIPSHQFNYREFTRGKEHSDADHTFAATCSNISILLRNPNPTSFLYSLFKQVNEDDAQYKLLINEIAVKHNLNDVGFFELSQEEMARLDEKKSLNV